MLEDVYNTRFNRIHPREYDGSYLTFPGISTDIDLYNHQRNAVARIPAIQGRHARRTRRGRRQDIHRRRRMPARRNVWAVPPSR